MAQIRITPETLESQATQLNSLKGQHDQVYSQIKSLMNDVSSQWEGQANAAFMQSFQTNDPVFKKFSDDVEIFRQRMSAAAADMRAAEDAVKAKMSQPV